MNKRRNINPIVLIPEDGCYLQKRGSVIYVMRIANKTWNKDTSTRVQPILNMIGRVCEDDDKYMIPNANYYSFYEDDSDPITSDEDSFSDTPRYGGYYLIYHALLKTGCLPALTSTFGAKNTRKIVAFTLYRLLNERNNEARFEYFAFHNFTNLSKNIDEEELTTFYETQINEQLIEKFTKEWVDKWSKNYLKEDTNRKITVCLNSANHVASQRTKELEDDQVDEKHDRFPHPNTAVFLSEATDHPLAKCQYRGSEIALTAINELKEYGNSIGLDDYFFIADRGYHSESNLKTLLNTNFALICNESDDTTKEQVLNNQHILDQSQYLLPDSNTACISYETEDFYGTNLKTFVYCDVKLRDLEIKNLNDNINSYENSLNNKHVYEDWMQDEYGYFFIFEKTEPTAMKKSNFVIKRNDVNIQIERDKCGFFVVVSNNFAINLRYY